MSTKQLTAKGQARKTINDLAFNYILSAIDCSGYTVMGTDPAGNLTELPVICETDAQKVNFVMETFESEYIHPNNRTGNMVNLFREYLMGLPSCINIDFENYKILEIAKQWGNLPANATERQEDKIIGNWFNDIANKFFQLHRRLNNAAKKGK